MRKDSLRRMYQGERHAYEVLRLVHTGGDYTAAAQLVHPYIFITAWSNSSCNGACTPVAKNNPDEFRGKNGLMDLLEYVC